MKITIPLSDLRHKAVYQHPDFYMKAIARGVLLEDKLVIDVDDYNEAKKPIAAPVIVATPEVKPAPRPAGCCGQGVTL